MIQYMPAITMFTITVLITTLFFVPVTRFPQQNRLINFYWSGFWVFLAMITAFSGASSIFDLLGVNVINESNFVLNGVLLAFVAFVVFAWFRLSGATILRFIRNR